MRLAIRGRGRVLWLVLAVLLVTLGAWNFASVYVRPGQWGVKQVVLGTGSGVHPDIFPPGLHFLTPGAERMHLFPADLQVLEMSDSQVPSAHIPNLRTVSAIKIQTSEGYTVSVDVTVLYRIENPYKVMTLIGPGRLYEDAVVIPRAEQQLRRTFGELDAEQFYKGDTREKVAANAQRLLAEDLSSKGITVTHVLVRQYRYDKRYQAAIESRKIQDQTVFKNQAEAQAAQAEAERNKIVAEGAASVNTEGARGNAEVQKLASEADLYTRTKAAEGELAVRLARAQGTQLENTALRGVGSENMVGLRMADALKGVEVIVLPSDGEGGTNPLDLNQLLRRFDVRGE
jgi:regulator of protease activity HflC (stomatin/prohibitin superfamily)